MVSRANVDVTFHGGYRDSMIDYRKLQHLSKNWETRGCPRMKDLKSCGQFKTYHANLPRGYLLRAAWKIESENILLQYENTVVDQNKLTWVARS